MRALIEMTLRELNGPEGVEGPDDDPAGDTSLIRRWNRARRMPLRELGPAEIRLLLGQETDLNILLPVAIAMLHEEPLLAAEFYEGDLLFAVLGAALAPEAASLRRSDYHMLRLRESATRALAELAATGEVDEVFEELRDLSERLAAQFGRQQDW